MECVLVSAAFGAYPVIGKIVESGSRFDAAERILVRFREVLHAADNDSEVDEIQILAIAREHIS